MLLNSRSKNIKDLVTQMFDSTNDLAINESTTGNLSKESYQKSYADSLTAAFKSMMGNVLQESAAADALINEDAIGLAQQFTNNLNELGVMNENATINTQMLAASIATTMRQPLEASVHRLYRTETVSDVAFMIHEKIPTVKAPNKAELAIFDAFGMGSTFIDDTEITITAIGSGGAGVANGAKNVNILDSFDEVYKVSKDVKISGIVVDPAVPSDRIRLAKGSSPYFDTKTSTASVVFEILDVDKKAVTSTVDVLAKIDFARGILETVYAPASVTKVYFDARVSHEEHTHPIVTGLKTKTETYTVPTRPHIEISVPEEVKQDIQSSNSPLKGVDLVSTLTEQALTISSRMEDLRLLKNLKIGSAPYEAEYDFEAPVNFANGNIKYFQQEFFPLLDQIAQTMKTEFHLFDAHVKVGVSPFLMTLIQPDYTITKGNSELEQGAVSYNIGIKTSASVFEIVATERLQGTQVRLNLIPNKKEDAELRTFNYIKYSSFLTDKLRKASNNALPAIVFSERNAALTFTDISCDLKITNLAIEKQTGTFIKRR